MRHVIVIIFFTGLFASHVASARTWYVRPDSTGDAPTIQAGIDSAAAADTVLLRDGTYSGDGNRDLDYGGKAITVVSEGGDPELCVVECGGSETELHRGFYFHSGETSDAVLEGMTIQGGYVMNQEGSGNFRILGGGLFCSDGSSPTITRCHFVSNSAWEGGGLACNWSSPTISECEFVGNTATVHEGGGLICADHSSPTISGCAFSENCAEVGLGGGIGCYEYCSPVIAGCSFIGNSAVAGGGIWYEPMITSPSISGCTFSGNVADYGGGISCRWGIGPARSPLGKHTEEIWIVGCTFVGNVASGGGGLECWVEESGGPHIVGCTLYGNSAEHGGGVSCDENSSVTLERTLIAFSPQGEAVYRFDGNSEPTLICCDLFGNAGGDWVGYIANQIGSSGNFSRDPLFCDVPSGGLTIEDCSPCLPGYHPDGYDCGGVIGAHGSGCACGTPTQATTWGAIKGRFGE